MGDLSTHQKDAGRISPPGGTQIDGVAPETAFGRELLLPPTSYYDGRVGLGGFGGIHCLSL